jgi:hypothetical protein
MVVQARHPIGAFVVTLVENAKNRLWTYPAGSGIVGGEEPEE